MITVKTYPELSAKYRETSCVAGIRLDRDTPEHVRLFPVPFRLLEEQSQFAKYAIVEVDVRRHQDQRPESLRPNLDTLKVVDRIGTSDGWRERYSLVRPLIAPSLCAIKRDQEEHGTSLGLFRPADTVDFRLDPAEPWPASKAALADQMDLLDQDLRQLEWVPLEFRYRFSCNDSRCTGHDLALRDWEAGESYRKFRRQYGEQGVEEKLRERWFTRMFTPDRAVHCFVGNLAKRPKTFMLLGLFYPRRDIVENYQEELFSL
ncbi:hypothetical protein OG785_17325 [Streptomyces sp. NBC_00006]|uniref:hypothetical protein n=1 Tax=unclassified Streptomyces TaxID=2593676 RepID=UPI002254C9A1|nr:MULTISPECIES: hypothetical protein [unclassified Streptomyces]MCX4828323.1 hypothetical protein [Streptomyces sp. NBC_01016]MCX5532325.1 hypothetical protein [Streptomyces sp. NBC_00006]